MIKRTDNAQAEQARRLKIKTQEQRLAKLTVEGAGLSPWEAETLTEVVKEVFFAEPQNNPLRSGQMFYECAEASEGAGKPLSECRLARVVLTIHDPESRRATPPLHRAVDRGGPRTGRSANSGGSGPSAALRCAYDPSRCSGFP